MLSGGALSDERLVSHRLTHHHDASSGLVAAGSFANGLLMTAVGVPAPSTLRVLADFPLWGRDETLALCRSASCPDMLGPLRDGASWPYRPLDLPSVLPRIIEQVVRQIIDPALADLRFLLVLRRPDQRPHGSMQQAQVKVLFAAIDGAAQLLHPGKMRDGARFQQFLLRWFPWERYPAQGLSVDNACEVL